MWSLYEGSRFLEPLTFSNNKTQKDVVEEVVNAIRKGEKIIFIHGACGTGKSAIALNIARELGRASIVVPGKNLQRQYKKDYEDKKHLLKSNNEKLSISILTGRNNHPCTFLNKSKGAIPVIKKEINAKLHDIFAGKREEIENTIADDESADNKNIPCKIEIRERNWERIRKYLAQNNLVDSSKLTELRDVKRASVASLCPYWSPVFKSEFEFGGPIFKSAKKRSYVGLNNTSFTFYERKKGCPFYEQFNAFIDADVLVFNALKYKLESAMLRKPATEVEIIDECDEFLDSFSNQKTLNLDRMQNALITMVREQEDIDEVARELFEILKHTKENSRLRDAARTRAIIPLKETGIYDLFLLMTSSKSFLDNVEDESYLFSVAEIANTFKEIADETFVLVEQKENTLLFNLVAINLAKQFTDLVEKNKAIVLMSGTLHSEEVLKEVFGIQKFTTLEAETQNQGELKIKRTGKETDCSYAKFSNGNTTREDYLRALNECVKQAQRPTLVHVTAFQDLPTGVEKETYNLNHLESREEVIENQITDKEGLEVRLFKKGQRPVLFSTRVARGADFPRDECRSIVFTKYPNPNVQDPFWRILSTTKPQHYWPLYKDKARRELLQKIYRGLRSPDDWVEVLSPDSRVIDFFEGFLKKDKV